MIHGNYNNWVGDDRLHSGTNYQMSHATWHSLNTANYDEMYTALLREVIHPEFPPSTPIIHPLHFTPYTPLIDS